LMGPQVSNMNLEPPKSPNLPFRLPQTQDGNQEGQPTADLRPNRSWVGFRKLSGKNHLTQIQPNPT
jgi:hypothetical protein